MTESIILTPGKLKIALPRAASQRLPELVNFPPDHRRSTERELKSGGDGDSVEWGSTRCTDGIIPSTSGVENRMGEMTIPGAVSDCFFTQPPLPFPITPDLGKRLKFRNSTLDLLKTETSAIPARCFDKGSK